MFADVRQWLEERISELAFELEPPSYSAYERDRQHTIVANCRVLLRIAQRKLHSAPANCSSAHLAYLVNERTQ